ncbi:hypothetical protein TNCV_4085181 [Trichonephila clavipes]|nr:hypothetical protein TNCV_4085181 [Trichonephila clavipes]
MIPPAHKAHQTVSFSGCNAVSTYTCGLASLQMRQKVWKKKLSLEEDLNLLQNLPSEISDVLTDDFSYEQVPENYLQELSRQWELTSGRSCPVDEVVNSMPGAEERPSRGADAR